MTVLEPIQVAVPRDRWQRPLVQPVGGGKPQPYTRCTRWIDVLDDTYRLGLWQQRMVALGMVDRADLRMAVAASRADNGALDKLCAQAKDAAGSSAAATTGTALHALTEQLDRGQEPVVPTEAAADLAAYAEATAELRAVHIERFCVQDLLRVGGTPDRVVSYQGRRYIADIKTGRIDYGASKIAMQLAVYARSELYDPETAARTHHGADLFRGIVIHLPAGTGTCTLHWVDLEAGWRGVQLARQVHAWRKSGSADVMRDFPSGTFGENTPEKSSEKEPQPLSEIIEECVTEIALRSLWAEHEKEWTETHTEQAKARIQAIRERQSK